MGFCDAPSQTWLTLAPVAMAGGRDPIGATIVQHARGRFRPSPNPLPLAMTMAALGVVYGEIGTNPRYALKEPPRRLRTEARRTYDPVLDVPR